MAAPDLITQGYLSTMLADMGLTANQLAMLPSLTTSASRAVRMHCNRYFTRTIMDELYTLRSPSTLVLNQYPVNGLIWIKSNPTVVLNITNTYSATNQIARFSLATTGSVDLGLQVVGVSLTWAASGVFSSISIPFNVNITIASVAAAINAVGYGWSAYASSGYELFPSADFRGVQGGSSALQSTTSGLLQHTTYLDATLKETSGIVILSGPPDNPFSSPRWGNYLAADYGDQQLVGAPNGIRASYDCGFDVIPEDVQQAVVETVQAMISRLDTDPSLSGEKIGDYGWTSDKVVPSIPDSAKQKLAPWRNVRG